jgi:hypothetical protein
MLVFMDTETFDQIELPADILGDRRPFLQDGMMVQIEYYERRGAERDAAAEGHLQGRRDRAGGEGPDRGQQLQARAAGQRRAVMVPPFVGQDEDDGREHRNDGIRRGVTRRGERRGGALGASPGAGPDLGRFARCDLGR